MMKTLDFCLKFRVLERASWDSRIITNMEKKSDWYTDSTKLWWGPKIIEPQFVMNAWREVKSEKTCESSAIISCYHQLEILIESVFLSHIIRVVLTQSDVIRPNF